MIKSPPGSTEMMLVFLFSLAAFAVILSFVSPTTDLVKSNLEYRDRQMLDFSEGWEDRQYWTTVRDIEDFNQWKEAAKLPIVIGLIIFMSFMIYLGKFVKDPESKDVGLDHE